MLSHLISYNSCCPLETFTSETKKTGPGNKHDLLILRKEAGCRAVRAMAEPEKNGTMPGGLASGVMIEPRTPEVGLGW